MKKIKKTMNRTFNRIISIIINEISIIASLIIRALEMLIIRNRGAELN